MGQQAGPHIHQPDPPGEPQAPGPPGLRSAAFLADPYPTYAWLRAHAPVYYSEEWQGFALTRYGDVLASFRDPRLSARRVPSGASGMPPAMAERLTPLLRAFSSWALFSDAPAHTRLRGLMNRAFAPRLVEAMRPRLQSLVDDLLRDFGPESTGTGGAGEVIDVVAGLAVPLPMLAIGEILGLPREEHALLKPWSAALAAFFGARERSLALIEQAAAAMEELAAYFRGLIARRRACPLEREDLLTSLMAAEEQGEILSEEELIGACSLLLFAGHETTTNLIGGAAWLLARRPDLQATLRAAPDALPAFVEEALRLESPVQRMGRLAAVDLELGGVSIAKGQRLWLMIGAANRDEAQFPHPDDVDLSREGSRHLAFGHGAHFCIGAALARMEAQLALGGLLRLLPQLTLAHEIPEAAERLDNLTVRGFSRLLLRSEGP